ncbi:MAG: hypothetical protein AUI57_10250 [Candidatus Rokubacteria bacterium 13_1_40CM_2_68_8]|nr:MAG: hypothetical protein AUI57_10250 [Candidatus Rokubacteria bacterium 13_1_40CM_2_68_8]PYN21267.1 MAG: hypothetical protein DMD99_20150 [Candidatus Rokubacteria bacterium]
MTRLVVPAFLLVFTVAAWGADVVIDDWKSQKLGARGVPEGWLGGQNWGLPQYDMTIEENEGHRVLHLRSKIESSVIRKDIRGKVNLKETPILVWSWKAVTLPKNGDCRKKSADDQAAQLYVVWPRFPEAVRSQIIGYIWDTTAPAGSIVKSEKTSTVTYVVMRSGPADLGKWITERRNVVEDYKKIYGAEPDSPGYISIAIDSDDTTSFAESVFGSILLRKP